MMHWVVTGSRSGDPKIPELTYKLARSDNALAIKRFELTLRIRNVTYTRRTFRQPNDTRQTNL